jgi:hypothetical protein
MVSVACLIIRRIGMSQKKKSSGESTIEAVQFEPSGSNSVVTSQSTKTQTSQVQEKEISVPDLMNAIFNSLDPNATDEQIKIRDDFFKKSLAQVISKFPTVMNNYNLLILNDDGHMVKSDADNIYNAVTAFPEKKPILLVLHSTGGEIASAYLIGKLCREYSDNKFVVVVPRQAKSAATLICCAADEIHMGSMSELGPIDPQIDGLPALGLKNSVEHLADLVRTYPPAAEMFAKYLSESLKLIHLGYYERVAESAKQYAERLLKLHAEKLTAKPENIAYDLVYTYKDHGFVIDKTEATSILGDKVIKTGTEEYNFGNATYQMMNYVRRVAYGRKYYFYFIGSPNSVPNFNKRSY